MEIFSNKWKKYNEIQLTKNKMDLNNWKLKIIHAFLVRQRQWKIINESMILHEIIWIIINGKMFHWNTPATECFSHGRALSCWHSWNLLSIPYESTAPSSGIHIKQMTYMRSKLFNERSHTKSLKYST